VRTYEVFDDDGRTGAARAPSASSSSSSSALALPQSALPAYGGGGDALALRFDAPLLAQHRSKALVHSRFSDLVPRDAASVVVARPEPGGAEELAAAARAQAAIDAAVGRKLASGRPNHTGSSGAGAAAAAAGSAGAGAGPDDGSRVVRYVPDRDAAGYNPAVPQRVIKMVEAQVDPLEPPKSRHKKVPGGAPDAPVPVMHSPPRKASLADQQAWKIPACVSNWKNARGYVVPLDKRVAADGRSLLEPTINDGFAKLSESLLIAERKARVEVEMRAAIQRKLALKAKEDKEAELRQLAARARLERAGIADVGGVGGMPSSSVAATLAAAVGRGFEGEALDEDRGRRGGDDDEEDDDPGPAPGTYAASASASSSSSSSSAAARRAPDVVEGDGDAAQPSRPQAAGESAEEYRARLDRERQRREHKRERERDMRLEASGRRGVSRAARDDDRDVGERVALGMPLGGGVRPGAGSEALYDARLFNQSEGVTGGFGAEDDYNVYSRPWRDGAGNAAGGVGDSIYRARATGAGALDDAAADAAIGSLREGASKRFKADGATDFEGVARGGGGGGRGPVAARPAGPVEFERGATDSGSGAAAAADPFGLDAIIGVMGASKPGERKNALDAVGKGRGGGVMAAMGGGAGALSREGGAQLGQGGRGLEFTRG